MNELTKATTILGMNLENACKWLDKVEQNTYYTLMKNFRDTIADYLRDYVEYTATFNGNITSTTPPTPLVQVPLQKGKLSTDIMKTLPPPVCSMYSIEAGEDGLSQWITWMTSVYAQITSGTFILGTNFQPTSMTTSLGNFPVFTSLSLGWSRDDLLGALENKQSIFDTIAGNIISDLKRSITIPSYPSSGTISMQPVLGTDTITGFIYP